MAADLLSAVKGHFKLGGVESDNWVFKLYYKVSFGLCLAGSILCGASTYIGNPITCDHKNVPSLDVVHQYCWLHGTYTIGKDYQELFGCIADQKRTYSEDVTTAYYQWVVFVLVLEAVLFLVPRKIWKIVEGGTISHFGTDAKSAFILADDDNMKKSLANYIKYFKVIKYKTDRYFANFVLCELLNFCVLVFNFCLTNVFLGHDFVTYGADVVNYYRHSVMGRKEMVNPMCNIFPTKVSCNFKFVGPSNQPQITNGLCILSQNIINEKIFLALWFWYVALMAVSSGFFIYRVLTIVVPSVRVSILCSKIGGSRRQVRQTVTRILRHSRPGDWFVLNQLGKNTNPLFFRELIMSIFDDMKAEHYMDNDVDLVSFEEKRGGGGGNNAVTQPLKDQQ